MGMGLSLRLGLGLSGSRSGSGGSTGDPNRYMFAGADLKPPNKRYQVLAGFENALSRWPITAPAGGAVAPRIGWTNWYLTEGGGSPVEDQVDTARVITAAYSRYRGTYYQHTFELMRGRTGLTVSGDGFSITIDPGLSCIADALPFTMLGNEVVYCETLEVSVAGDWRGGGRVPWTPRGEGIEYSASSLASKLANSSVLANNVGGGVGGYVPGPAVMFAKGWDGSAVVLDKGHSIHRGVAVTTESTTLRGGQTGYDLGLDAAQVRRWNESVSGFTIKSLPGSGGLTGIGRSKAMYALLDNPGGALPFTCALLPGDVNDKTASLATWQQNHLDGWATMRSEFPGIRLIQETCPPYTNFSDATREWTDQASQIVSSSVSTAVWQAGGIKTQLNTWLFTQVGVGNGPDAIFDARAVYSEDANYVLARNDLTGASTPKMADGVLAAASAASANSIIVTTTQPPAVGAFLLVGVGVASADEMTVQRVSKRPDIGTDAWQIYAAGSSPTTSGTITTAHPLAAVVKEQPTTDGLHYSANFQRYIGDAIRTSVAASLFGAAPALITTYQSEAQSYFDRLPAVPSGPFLTALDDFFRAAKMCSFWNVTDAIYDLTAPETSAYINMKSTSFTLTKTGTVTFSNGAQGDGTTGYLDTGYNPVTAALNWQYDTVTPAYNSASFGAVCLSNITEDRSDMGNSGLALEFKRASGSAAARVNGNAVGAIVLAASNPTSFGHLIANRNASNVVGGYKNGAFGTAATQSATAPASATIRILNGASGFSTKKLGLAHIGGAITDDMAIAMYRASYALMRAKGAM